MTLLTQCLTHSDGVETLFCHRELRNTLSTWQVASQALDDLMRKLLYRPRPGLGWPLWVDAPSFDLADHIRVRAVAAPGDQAQLLAACQELARRRLDPARPLWELWLLPGLPDRQLGAPSFGCITPSPTVPRRWPPSERCWT